MQWTRFFGVALITTLAACPSKPATETASTGEVCHRASDNSWKHCDGKALCLFEEDRERLEPRKPITDGPLITTTQGTINNEDYDCFGILSRSCVRKGVCTAKVGLGEPCASDEMCLEGGCRGSISPDGLEVWRCVDPTAAPAPATDGM